MNINFFVNTQVNKASIDRLHHYFAHRRPISTHRRSTELANRAMVSETYEFSGDMSTNTYDTCHSNKCRPRDGVTSVGRRGALVPLTNDILILGQRERAGEVQHTAGVSKLSSESELRRPAPARGLPGQCVAGRFTARRPVPMR
ncbi:hypothetical protein EVAR_874_1 [Eumeta japonica]|uniref:Uncharacterized protein n=1 Tax=Eumeta variegata TaxID=151549 RepID=A0A4C1SDZ5_EUMVA|nr:hypothetical protein EVAR_874_1 [Eumeta japonica]